MDYVLNESVLGAEPFAMPGVSFAISASDVMERLLDMAGDRDPSQPRFVFAHVLAPHPPFFLDRDCDESLDPTGVGFFYPYPGIDAATRDSRFMDQLACVNGFVNDFVSTVSDDDVVVFLSDHGTGRSAQLDQDPRYWTKSSVIERMNAFLTVRVPDPCEVGSPISLPNVMRRVLRCLGAPDIDDLPIRIFLSGDHELTPSEIESLLVSGAGS
jgi:hypothetical protein